MVDMDYQTREAVSSVRTGWEAMMDAKHACIDKSRWKVRTFFECLREERIDFCVDGTMFLSPYSQNSLNTNIRDFQCIEARNFTIRKQLGSDNMWMVLQLKTSPHGFTKF